MDKKNIQDVVPPTQRKSIRNIPIPNRNNKDNDIRNEDIKIDDTKTGVPPIHSEEEFDYEERDRKPRKNNMKKYLILIGSIITLVLIFAIFTSLDSAKVKITPKTETSSFNERIVIEELSKRESNESLGYRIIELAKESEKVVEAQSEELVQSKASGEITIFNEYSENSQTLIKNTRFESTNGRIYRIEDSIKVPGYTESNGDLTPGQLTVIVYADEIGEDYNTESDDFTIPGFEGQEPFDFFYAKTNTPISGGFDGIRKIVSQEDIGSATTELQEEVKSKLLDELNNQVTEEFYIYQNDESFSYGEINEIQVENSNNVKLTLRGEVSARIFNKVDTSNKIADSIFANYFTNENTLISDFDNVNISISESELSETLEVSGDSNFVWQINEEKLKDDLKGEEKKLLPTIMQDYTEIQVAEAIVKPFWISTFPEDKKDIKIEIIK
jgi:hypothetical protein